LPCLRGLPEIAMACMAEGSVARDAAGVQYFKSRGTACRVATGVRVIIASCLSGG